MSLDKSFLDKEEEPLLRSLQGYVEFNTGIEFDRGNKVLYRNQLKHTFNDKVLLLSGGGSGHEPAHIAYLGQGMLDIVVAGNIFASPSTSQILAALKAFPSRKGILIIVKNYTGDVLNFGLAAEKAQAAGILCKLLIVGDDVSVPRRPGSLVGRRGLAGTVLVHKILGALATQGESLEKLHILGEEITKGLVTVGASLNGCHVPGRVVDDNARESQSFELEYGMGIHNEPGVSRAPLPTLQELVSTLLNQLLDEKDVTRNFVRRREGDEWLLLINNLGGSSLLDLTAVASMTLQLLHERYRIEPKLLLYGQFMGSLNAPGLSITMLRLNNQVEDLLKSPTDAPGWKEPIAHHGSYLSALLSSNTQKSKLEFGMLIINPTVFERVLRAVSASIYKEEPEITRIDTLTGDGDCGETLIAGSNSISKALDCGDIDLSNVISGLQDICNQIEPAIGGTSGAIYSIYLNALISGLNRITLRQDPEKQPNAEAKNSNGLDAILAEACSQALSKLYQYTPARKGHRTMMDALIPFVDSFEKQPYSFVHAVDEAVRGAAQTGSMKPSLGRATYVSSTIWETEKRLPDPGALGICAILNGIKAGLNVQTEL